MKNSCPKNKSLFLTILGAAFILAVPVFFLLKKESDFPAGSQPPISRIQGSFSIDTENQRELIGDADYVFVGQIAEKTRTVYKNPVMGEDEKGNPVDLSTPYTNFTVFVLDNIKGELRKDKAIPIQKAGGLSKDGSQYFIFENDRLPAINEIYIFFAYAQKDGSLLVTGPNSSQLIAAESSAYSDDPINAISASSLYKEITEAAKTEVITERERFVSKYDTTVPGNRGF